ncbi:MAG: DNA-processing protein DprA [Candidatus Lokiarchaeia archaeon]
MYLDESDLYLILLKESRLFSDSQLMKIYQKFGNFKIAYNSSLENFISKDEKLDKLRTFLKDKDQVNEKIKKINDGLIINEIHFLSYFNSNYPEPLKSLSNPPIGIFFKGELNSEDINKSISIIGTRDPSFFGHTKARSIARELAKQGYTIISGLARGIDLEAHIGALEGGGKTIAILGSPIKKIYPREHNNLVNDILSNGAIISEFLGESTMRKYDLVNRNRIIAALSIASLIIEGTLSSGTRYEVNYAKKLKKMIFTLRPKDRENKISQLPISLIEEGNLPINSTNDILNYLRKNKRKDITSFM